MKIKSHIVKNKIGFSKWYKWIALILLLLFLLCCFFKGCNKKEETNENNSTSAQINNDTTYTRIDNKKRYYPLPIRKKRIINKDLIEIDRNDPLEREHVSNLINVYLHDGIDMEEFSKGAQQRLSQYKLIPIDTAEAYNRIQFEVNRDEKDEIILAFKKDSLQVKYATNEWIFKNTNTMSQFNDPGFENKNNIWFYESVGILDAWKYTKGDKNIRIAVLDDGFDLEHHELKNQFDKPWNVWDYNDKVNATKINRFHGTHVAGTIIGEANNNYGISGVAPSSTFIPIQLVNESGIITMSALLDGIFYALKNKVNIINLSIAMQVGNGAKYLSEADQIEIKNSYLKDEEKLWNEVFDLAIKEGVIIVQAAGNENLIAGVDPMKRSKNSVVVGSINHNKEKSSFSNYGDNVDIFVPGEKIYSALPENNMGYLDGTSMASPIVAGAIALIMSYYPDLNTEEVIKLLYSSKDNDKTMNLTKIFNA